jgi:hypothetical protein
MLYIVIEKGSQSVSSDLVQRFVYTVKKGLRFARLSRDVTNQTLPGRE